MDIITNIETINSVEIIEEFFMAGVMPFDKNFEFVPAFVKDMAHNADYYLYPKDYLEEVLTYGAREMTNIFKTDEDCKRIYIKYMDDFDACILKYNDSIKDSGYTLEAPRDVKRYRWICETVYFMLAHGIFLTLNK